MAIAPTAHNSHLIVFYACMTSTIAFTTIVFWSLFWKYDKINVVEGDVEMGGVRDRNMEMEKLSSDYGTSILISRPTKIPESLPTNVPDTDIEHCIEVTNVFTASNESA